MALGQDRYGNRLTGEFDDKSGLVKLGLRETGVSPLELAGTRVGVT
jgi:hypothetical protein